MMIQAIEEARRRLGEVIDRAEALVVLTGAGISTECGVPDFRSPESPWRRYPPIDFSLFLASAEARVEAWRRKFTMDDVYAGAQPGRTHRALANLAGAGRLDAVLTQNIDGLHQAAGLPDERLVELHGNGTHARCLTCAARHELRPIREHLERAGQPPACAICGGVLKSATIAFGQSLPREVLERARTATLRADTFVVLGSSLVVRPAALLPAMARQNGAVLVVVNREPTPLDGETDLLIRADVGAVLEPWSAGA